MNSTKMQLILNISSISAFLHIIIDLKKEEEEDLIILGWLIEAWLSIQLVPLCPIFWGIQFYKLFLWAQNRKET